MMMYYDVVVLLHLLLTVICIALFFYLFFKSASSFIECKEALEYHTQVPPIPKVKLYLTIAHCCELSCGVCTVRCSQRWEYLQRCLQPVLRVSRLQKYRQGTLRESSRRTDKTARVRK